MTPRDLKSFGLPSTEPTLPAPVKALCRVLAVVIVVGTACGLVADEADRLVIMSRAEHDKQIAQERIKAAQEVMDAVGTCTWRDQFTETPRVRKGRK